MKIYALVDYMAIPSEKDEYNEIKEVMESVIGHGFVYKTGIRPDRLDNEAVDIYIIDWGGVLPGAEGMVRYVYRALLGQIENKPSTLFVLWSHHTERWYSGVVRSEFPEITNQPNVIFWSSEKAQEAIRAWVA